MPKAGMYKPKPFTYVAESHLQYHNSNIITIPKRFVESLGWKTNDRLEIQYNPKRKVLVVSKPDTTEADSV